jgi:hypothetical protein
MVIFTVFSEIRFSEGRRMKLSQKKAQFHTLLCIVLLIMLDFRWHCRIASLVTITATGRIYDR